MAWGDDRSLEQWAAQGGWVGNCLRALARGRHISAEIGPSIASEAVLVLQSIARVCFPTDVADEHAEPLYEVESQLRKTQMSTTLIRSVS